MSFRSHSANASCSYSGISSETFLKTFARSLVTLWAYQPNSNKTIKDPSSLLTKPTSNRDEVPHPTLSRSLGAGVTPAQGSVKPTAGFTFNKVIPLPPISTSCCGYSSPDPRYVAYPLDPLWVL